ncbi:MAG TPA: pantetheine-phosphate adenylyltransferase [Clostridiales bacterium]|nr:pantetheine-phosphate adenylyltransferase [Clostridiales bacterium]
MTTYVCPGSYDPVTSGHVDIIKRAMAHCDKLIIAVGDNSLKNSFFTLDEKIMFLKKVFKEYDKIEIESFTGLTVDFAEQKNASALVRGLRAVSDFEYEFQMAMLNKKLKPHVETIFMMANPDHSYISSGAVREFLKNNADITGLVPESIRQDMIALSNKKLMKNQE